MSKEIECMHCKSKGSRDDLHRGGWELSKNKPFYYVCTNCKSTQP